ncbi:dTDP-6-deoxy-L-hexose 3-O-methyltransferase [Candidatus Shapirobacteria bacterium CG_4_9_14_0_2_um_filter_40_11]|uniref:dTDP-6-deoxy-L-hexose 3-O-methyltransferase n=1 Tax=Candidatus Shapirobacteria bacterium CG_4_9_14_0_2_um_filter_40_11 TaxID=1974876 RepID=A0A2M8EUI0_9BACT|nr:MAG: dTDP-6-deoxy-L-hexose 3-O-methyltransferase [Candidatus Shapirobacteria bacterium CG_4_9_14_0_2_um_filter_40_11]
MKKLNKKRKINLEGGLRTQKEKKVLKELSQIFNKSPESTEIKLENFPKYVRRQKITRLLSLYELFKKVLSIKGSIIECGVHRGFGLMTWTNLSAILEPNNLTRRIYGFDTFGGFPSIADEDKSQYTEIKPGSLSTDSLNELKKLIKIYDANRFLGHIDKVRLIKGDASRTIPAFIKERPHLVVSLLFLDFDLFEPTKVAIENFYPRMPRGSIIAFDELDNPIWPGETLALLKTIGINKLKIERFDFDPYIGYAVLDKK